MVQHRAIVKSDEVVYQGHRRHATLACNYASLHPNGGHTPLRGVVQVCNERRLPGCTAKVQGSGEDQVGPRQGPHACTTGTQVEVVVVVQGGQGNMHN